MRAYCVNLGQCRQEYRKALNTLQRIRIFLLTHLIYDGSYPGKKEIPTPIKHLLFDRYYGNHLYA